MNFRLGYTVRPKEINSLNVVIFEEWDTKVTPNVLVDVLPTADECSAYGFVFNDKCFILPNQATDFIPLDDSIITGSRNITDFRNYNNIIAGTDNTLIQGASNDLIVGDKNTIELNTSNSFAIGTLGEVTANNSIVIGGNATGDNLAERQYITLMYGLQTTGSTTKASYLNNTIGSYFKIPINSILYFHAEIIAVCVASEGGEGASAVGDFASWLERGVVINQSGVLSIKRQRKTMSSNGSVTNWRPTASVNATDFYIAVRGSVNTTVEWNTSINFTQIKTGVDL